MPIFIEFLLAPWKILAVFGLASKAATTGPGGATVPTGLCYAKDLGGQIAQVCHVGGYEMPSFVFWASILILALFAASSLSLLNQCLRVATALTRLADEIRPSGGDRAGLDADELARLGKLMRKEPLVAPAWEQFEETLLEGPYATCPVDSVLSRSALIDENVSLGFFNAVPGILTGLGLLMTFVAILDGLAHVSVGANMDVSGIGGLINGLSGKFVSSIVAVSCAVAFVFVERGAYARPREAHRRFLSRLVPKFRRRTAEHLLHSIQQQLEAQARLLSELRPRGGKGA